ncbi:hypothetical protein A3D66_01160 [Candidatus Kaiserbacteria bacterium RIFCSPHIGHO2_02_FULL_50_9]|uniref:Uncharacterized protein n=1 Tax=Candidatus Kaiserbacteria bacterium RIFCSPLOWO2_01_FULL_51_21 TaxID=1798508 RepID=A0A1F6EF09_9BACT|nr:MAG: hypothetical protein A2761_01595 [Candidatus Kaiserbacteria bacterium RIFCSPHIGHO2_01_FULL_51_33]OGG63506.1 MAG: hypothetical protein A3D66_01160 [Candidatus Kaiserbacteria bacterium RIFCSPHIGHO2_02_FULL_50_9]OGG71802.1 MAG: hypothetical protein A3A35_02680 [Candidatus Kaiserbacteria bacterium RIFCSPLOWO2_01_FULL_51_21]
MIPLEIRKVGFSLRDTYCIFKNILTNLNIMNGNAFNRQRQVEKIIFHVQIKKSSKQRMLGVSYL